MAPPDDRRNGATPPRIGVSNFPETGYPPGILPGEAMSNRRFEMYQYRQALVRMRQGDSDRVIAQSGLMGCKMVCATLPLHCVTVHSTRHNGRAKKPLHFACGGFSEDVLLIKRRAFFTQGLATCRGLFCHLAR